MITTNTRNATLADLRDVLMDQQARKVDMVVSAGKIRSRDGLILVSGAEPVISMEGVTSGDGRYRPTVVADEGIAAKLGIPLAYMRKLRAERPDLYDGNVNGWLRGKTRVTSAGSQVIAEPDSRSFMLRTFRGDEGEEGVLRAFLSDRYNRVDNLDVLLATLQGIREAGVAVNIEGADLSDRKMYVRVSAPEVLAYAPALLRGYRSPFSGESGADNPIVESGFVISNSEVGGGAFSIVPRIKVRVCSNGMTITKDALRQVHLGGKLEEGTIEWSQDTGDKALALVQAKTRDAVKTFLNREYVEAKIAEMTEAAGVRVAKPAETLKVLGKKLQFDEDTVDGILDHFIRGGDTTSGGVMHAVTSFAQTVEDADTAADLEANAWRAMELAAAEGR